MNKLYYMDGYHGGIRGHMPLGSWRDILDQLKLHPEWRLSIDVEPVSWDYLKERDPEAYAEFAEMVKDDSAKGRLEIVAGSYAQPYGWITDGESNIRHLTMGLDILKKHFPETTVDTYAVQEPCWTSALPQILCQLGFKRASLKDASTAWGGYTGGYPAEAVDWTGPDGTSIPTAPRYHCEELVNVYETEACAGTPEYTEKCIREGIPHPTGMYYQDLGWAARPGKSDADGTTPEYVEYTTWRDYFENITDVERPTWQPGQEIFRGALPWGELVLVRMARQVRRCEVEMLDAERLCALAGDSAAEERLNEAWGHLLMTQHHDGWICAGAGVGERNWAWKTSAQVYAAEFLFDRLRRDAFASMINAIPTEEGRDESILVVNPLAKEEIRMVRVEMTGKIGTQGFEVYDGDTRLSAQAICHRKHRDGSWNAGELVFTAKLPALGAKTFRVVPQMAEPVQEGPVRVSLQGSLVVLENEFYHAELNLERGGVMRSYVDRVRNVELVPEGADFNEYKGYFIKEQRFCSNTESPAEAEIVYSGALEACVVIRGKVADVRFEQRYTVQTGSPRLDVQARFFFADENFIGEPYQMQREYEDETGRHFDAHRTYHDGRYRLNAYFPTVFDQKNIDKDCAYDVCRSTLEDTHFKTWNEIKHNVLLHWVDATDERQGLAVLCDHTTAYIHGGGSPLGLALAWGYDAGFWWGRRPLKGIHEVRYQLMAHAGNWRSAGLWHECEKFLHVPLARRSNSVMSACENSAFEVKTDGVELGSMYTHNGATYIRLFNAGETCEATCSFDARSFSGLEETAPDGTGSNVIPAAEENSRGFVHVNLPAFAIRTYRLIDR